MRPISLEMQAFGPYIEKQVIDFEKLSSKGIFLIRGITGSGKSSIFDAMMFSLYGEASDSVNKERSEFEQWRCNQAPKDLTTLVRFTFEVRGKRYVFGRELTLKKTLFRKSWICSRVDGGREVPFFEKPSDEAVRKKAQELIGLTKEQFRQVVILPQGQFEDFLVSKSKDKQDILSAIFQANLWQAYVDRLYVNANNKAKELNDIKKRVETSLHDEAVNDLSGLEERIEEKRRALKELEEEQQSFDSEGKRRRLNEDRVLSEKFTRLHELEKRLQRLEAQKPEIDEKQKRLIRAQNAEDLREDLTKYQQLKTTMEGRGQDLLDIEKSLPKLKSALEKSQSEKTRFEREDPITALNEKRGAYQSKAPLYDELGKLRTAFEEAKQQSDDAAEKHEIAGKAYESIKQRAQAAKASFDQENKLAITYRNQYFSGIYGEIASSLEEDRPCPVCGSVHHPNPAARRDDAISQEDYQAQEEKAEKAKNDWQSAETDREKAEAEKAKLQAKAEGEAALFSSAKAKLEAAEKTLLPGIESKEALEKAMEAIEEAISQSQRRQSELSEAERKAAEAYAKGEQQHSGAQRELLNAENAFNSHSRLLDALLTEKGYAGLEEAVEDLLDVEALRELQNEITQYETSCQGARENLESARAGLHGEEEPDASAFEERENEIQTAEDRFQAQSGAISAEIVRLDEKRKRLAEDYQLYESEIQQASSDLTFAKRLRGESGIGLQRYVLAVMFGQVIAEANRMLEKVHGGRYQLYRTEEGKDRQKGLDLMVYDRKALNGQGRNVQLLSGGEKFLVSLALSIGLSTVAQGAGIHTEALFIDEGFGTLDESSIGDAMNILEGMRKGKGMIGIISHVQVLADHLPNQLYIEKTDSGSRVREV